MRLLPALLIAVAPIGLSAQRAAEATRPVKIQGTVHDSLTRVPLSGAHVEFVRSDAIGTGSIKGDADGGGRFTLQLTPGEWMVQLSHPSYDSLGIELPTRRITVPANSVHALALATPSATTLVRAHCPESAGSTGVLVGMVRHATTDAPLDSVKVQAEYSIVTIDGAGLRTTRQRVSAQSNRDGWYVGCDVPVEGELALWASRGDAATGVVALPPNARAVRRFDLTLDPSAVRGRIVAVDSTAPVADPLRPTARSGGRRVSVLVQDAAGRPVPGARGRVLGHPVTLGDASGRLVLDSLPGGTQTLEVRAIGFVPVSETIDVGADRATVDTVRLLSVNALLDTIRVTSRSAYSAGGSQFEKRRLSGMGLYVTRDEIEKRHAIDVSDLFIAVPGLKVSSVGFDKRVTVTRAGLTCTPAIYLDGVMQCDGAANDLEFIVRPSEIVGIEIYKGFAGTPPEFIPPGGTTCGSIVIWTGTTSAIPRRPIEPDR